MANRLDPEQAWSVVQRAILAFSAKVPDMAEARRALISVLETEAWAHYQSPTGKTLDYEQFAEWVCGPVPNGLDTTVENLWEIAKGDRVLRGRLAKVGLPKIGEYGTNRHSRGDIITSRTSRGDDPEYLTARLKRDHSDLAEKVTDGAISASAAARQVGIRHRYLSVRADNAASAARTLRKHMSPDQLAELARLLTEEA